MRALQPLLLQLPPSLMALSQGILPSLPTLDMASRLLQLHHRGKYPLVMNQMKSEFDNNTSLFTDCVCPALSLSYNANSQPASYSQSSYSQPAAYGQQQPGYQAQQASYGQQQGYQQQGQQQQAPPAYPPQAASSYGQPPANQYNQQGGPPSYNQSNHYSKICFSPTPDCCFIIFVNIVQCHCRHMPSLYVSDAFVPLLFR